MSWGVGGWEGDWWYHMEVLVAKIIIMKLLLGSARWAGPYNERQKWKLQQGSWDGSDPSEVPELRALDTDLKSLPQIRSVSQMGDEEKILEKDCVERHPAPSLSSFLKAGGTWIWFQQSSPRACSVLCLLVHSVALQGNLEASDSPSRESERTRGREEGHAPQDLSVCRCTSVPRGQRSATWRGSQHEVPWLWSRRAS